MDLVSNDAENQGDMAEEIRAVEIDAELRQIKSKADHTYDLVLNVPEYCLPQVKELMGWLLSEVTVTVINGGE